MIGVYFSGTGNTKYCTEKFLSYYDSSVEMFSLESTVVGNQILQHDMILLAYPIYYSQMPKIVKDFIINNHQIWKNKKIFIICTMGLFSGDGAGTAARLLKKYGAIIIGGLHVKMPDCICDVKLLKYSLSKNKQIISDADNKLKIAAQHIQQGMIPNDGLNILDHIAGLFGQRLWFYKKTQQYSNQLNINSNCIGCGLCTQHCPMNNLMLNQGKALAKDHCTMCYRCINQCPQKAITLLGKKVIVQHSMNEYK